MTDLGDDRFEMYALESIVSIEIYADYSESQISLKVFSDHDHYLQTKILEIYTDFVNIT